MRGGRALFALAILLVAGGAGCGGRKDASEGRRTPGPRRATLPPGSLPWVGRLAIDWTRGSGPREHILIGPGGLELGPSEGPLTRYLFNGGERADDVRFFVDSFAPFTVAQNGEDLVFRGAGPAAASLAEKRMIVSWAHRVVAEAVGGRGGASYGVALAWHRGGDAYGGCDEAVVSLSGEARAGDCGKVDAGGEHWRGRLTEEQLRRLYGWFDAWAPFQTGGGDADPTGAAPVRLIFAGQGKASPKPSEKALVADFAAGLYHELAARHPAPKPPPAAIPQGVQARPTGKGAPPVPAPAPPAPEPAGPRLLRPETPPATRTSPTLAVPENPPPPPAPRAAGSAPPPPRREL
jgi:hypothetical protein